MAEYKPEYGQDLLDSRYKNTKIANQRVIPYKGFSGITTVCIAGVLMTYGWVKYIHNQRIENEYRKQRAAERSELIPIIKEYIAQRDSGNTDLLNHIQHAKNREIIQQYKIEQTEKINESLSKPSMIDYITLSYWLSGNTFKQRNYGPIEIPYTDNERKQKELQRIQHNIDTPDFIDRVSPVYYYTGKTRAKRNYEEYKEWESNLYKIRENTQRYIQHGAQPADSDNNTGSH